MQVQTQDLIGPALDWAVAFASSTAAAQGNFALARAQADIALARGRSYSTDWAIGGCILENEDIELRRVRRPGTVAWEAADGCDAAALAEAPTRLIAAMRCFVTSRLGAQVEVPDAVVAMSAQKQVHAIDHQLPLDLLRKRPLRVEMTAQGPQLSLKRDACHEDLTEQQTQALRQVNEALAKSVDAALDEACSLIQDALGVQSGDVASLYFSGHGLRSFLGEEFGRYALAELRHHAHISEAQDDTEGQSEPPLRPRQA